MAPPIYVKGGVWTNVEDQILRAAVSKYGLTQWARVASLLPKKTAKQAKARWNEYLNPQINRNEWTREEDEKLLSLAKLIPNQWRSIAPIMGRTATQCVERYQKLLEDAIKGENSDESDGEDLKYSGPGIETLPALGNAFESLPSRPDMEDMDDDEREMLSEAKSRLANTQGKKAKRKERERMLEESKRISLLQKRRELKAAGIKVSLELKNRKKRKEFDYNADIPHEHAPPRGFYDTTDEQQKTEDGKLLFQKKVSLKGMNLIDVEEGNRKKIKDVAKRESERLLKEIRSVAEKFTELAEQEYKRRKLNIPAAGELNHGDIESRIKLRTQEILASKNHNDRIPELPVSAVLNNTAHNSRTEKLPKKVLMNSIHNFLKALPKASSKVQLILPQLDPHEEMLTEVEYDLQNAEAIQLFQLTGDTNKNLQESQVIQRGLDIPNPETFIQLSNSLSPVEAEISREFLSLVTSDFTQFSDPHSFKKNVDNFDEADLIEVDKLISEELKCSENGKSVIVPIELPKSENAINNAFNTILELSKRAEDDELRLDQSWEEYHESAEATLQELQEKHEELTKKAIEEKLVTTISEQEKLAIKLRSSRLHELVEKVGIAEKRILKD